MILIQELEQASASSPLLAYYSCTCNRSAKRLAWLTLRSTRVPINHASQTTSPPAKTNNEVLLLYRQTPGLSWGKPMSVDLVLDLILDNKNLRHQLGMNAINQIVCVLFPTFNAGSGSIAREASKDRSLRLWLLETVGEGNQVIDLLGNRTLRGTTNGALAFHADLIVPYFHDILLKPGINILQLLQSQSVNANLLFLSQSHTSTTAKQDLGLDTKLERPK
jgi:hypothetical protein